MRSDDRWDFRENIRQTFARTKARRTVITVAADAAQTAVWALAQAA
jgi:hypothetical protein